MAQVFVLEVVDAEGSAREVELRIGEPSVARVELVEPDGVFEAADGDYLDCLILVRRHLEERGLLLCCQGARPDVWPSGMLRQFANGREAYVLDPERRGEVLETVDIFAPAPAGSVVDIMTQGKAVFAFNGLTWPGS
ncbi:hypothetical protein Lfu02_77460 [Longispora fulva]|uniref:Uncharacterized protein n=1 Tax=Longispora fulva TaxID=619741 RepID=A0A8J7KPC2_9ACTN|nr:hypothetical protein [Longispora fulva]MBG6136137.1 hypothetical protein [Longispora fulva]GIG63374.1 hypothetical protein Lfu02_77460 [Longispora fulva]